MKTIYTDYKLQNLGYTLRDEQTIMKLVLYEAEDTIMILNPKINFRSWVHFQIRNLFGPVPGS